MSVYATLAPEQVAYVAGHAQPSVVVLEGRPARPVAARARGVPEHRGGRGHRRRRPPRRRPPVRGLDRPAGARPRGAGRGPGRYDDLWRSVRPEDPLTILYTSGTTGNPKGVVLTHRNILFETETSLDVSGMREPGVTVSYLPFAHIAERMLGIYIPQYQGGHVHLVGDPALLVGALGEVHPTRFFGVPRVWEKVRTGVSACCPPRPTSKVAAVAKAMDVGLRYVESLQTGEQTSPVAEEFRAMDAAVLRRSGRCSASTGWSGRPAPPRRCRSRWPFFAGLGLSIYDVYGMTETSAVVTGNGPDQFRLGSVGRPCGVEVRLGDDREILVRGPVSMPGYLGRGRHPAARRRGRVAAHRRHRPVRRGRLLLRRGPEEGDDHHLRRQEHRAVQHRELPQGEPAGRARAGVRRGRPYCVAVLTLDGEVAPQVARRNGIEFTDLADLARNPQVRALVQQSVDAANERLSRPEQVKGSSCSRSSGPAERGSSPHPMKRRVVHAKCQEDLWSGCTPEPAAVARAGRTVRV